MKIGDKIRYSGDPEGRILTIIRIDEDGDPIYRDEDGYENNDYAYMFEVVSSYSFDYALSMVGKNVIYQGKPFMVEAVTVFNKYYPSAIKTVQKEVKELGYSIVLENDDGFAPLSEVEEISNTVVLNDEYTAVIDGETVKVGCQTIPIQKVEEILKTFKKLKG